jgi:hypothetical protein
MQPAPGILNRHDGIAATDQAGERKEPADAVSARERFGVLRRIGEPCFGRQDVNAELHVAAERLERFAGHRSADDEESTRAVLRCAHAPLTGVDCRPANEKELLPLAHVAREAADLREAVQKPGAAGDSRWARARSRRPVERALALIVQEFDEIVIVAR